jgi:hypothetical protein
MQGLGAAGRASGAGGFLEPLRRRVPLRDGRGAGGGGVGGQVGAQEQGE